jgi:general secretion pathway protein H
MTSPAGNRPGNGDEGERGFTLIELIVVLVILAAAMAVSYPSFTRGSAAVALRASARDVLNTFRHAREKAVTEQIGLRLAIDRERGELVLADSAGREAGRYTLPGEVAIERLALGEREIHDGGMVVRFLPNGSFEGAQVVLRSRTGSRLRIVSDPARGGARIETGPLEAFP